MWSCPAAPGWPCHMNADVPLSILEYRFLYLLYERAMKTFRDRAKCDPEVCTNEVWVLRGSLA
jgi:hypothetical protein